MKSVYYTEQLKKILQIWHCESEKEQLELRWMFQKEIKHGL